MTLQTLIEELSRRPGTGEVIPIIDPATEETIAEFTDGGAAADVDPEMRLCQQEIFGPVVAVLRFDDDEVVALAD